MNTCPRCSQREPSVAHLTECQKIRVGHEDMERLAAATGIPPDTMRNVWSHTRAWAADEWLGEFATATRVVHLFVDLGWRPVLGPDPTRRWQPKDVGVER